MKPIAIWGSSGHAKVLVEFLGHSGYELTVLFDSNAAAVSPFPGVPLYVGRDGFATWRRIASGTSDFLVAIGGDRGRDRCALHDYLVSQGMTPATVIHPTAFVAGSAQLGPGGQVLAQAAVCAEVKMGRSCIINTGASVDHESTLGDGVHIAPGAVVAGCAKIGARVMIGIGALVLPRITIGDDAVIGAGSVVTKNIPARVTAYGAPARIIRHHT
jgi:sugar O-acyltransferase (sialic acid O-acetyltransferase NeuD family)